MKNKNTNKNNEKKQTNKKGKTSPKSRLAYSIVGGRMKIFPGISRASKGRFVFEVSKSTSGLCPFLHAASAADLSLREQVRPGAAAAAQLSATQGRRRLVPLDARLRW
jgi:hypothetical protein